MEMGKIKSKKQFKEQVDAAFATMQTRDEAKTCYEFQREEYKAARRRKGRRGAKPLGIQPLDPWGSDP